MDILTQTLYEEAIQFYIIIEKYPDKITMANPGTIIAGKNQMLKGASCMM